MSQQELLKKVISALDSCGISYMLTGSLASSLYGEPRATHDIDLVADLPAEKIDQLSSCFASPSYFLQKDAIHEAVTKASMFNLLAIDEGDKVDFWMLTNEPFDQSRFARRITKNIAGLSITVSTPEDTILAKLNWCRLAGGSEKQRGDVLRVYEVQRDTLDETYITKWATELDVAELWDEVRAAAGDIETGGE